MMTYTVIRGDTLWHIARIHGLTLQELLAVNPQITNPNLIFPGQVINIPKINKNHYTVKQGDSMWQIAKNLNVTPQDLMENNPQISNPNTLFPGQIIYTPSDDTAPIIPSTPVVPSDIKNLETEVVKLINSERTKTGRAVLTENSNLSNAARLKSEDFVNNKYFSHESPTYGSPFNMLSSLGITYTAAAENIASGQRSAEEVMKYWMNSPGHRANILSSSYNQIGVGVARDQNGNLYWTQLFIKN